MTSLSILLSFWTSPIFSGIIATGLIYVVMILGGRVVKEHISPKVGKVIIGFGYLFMIMGIVALISMLFG